MRICLQKGSPRLTAEVKGQAQGHMAPGSNSRKSPHPVYRAPAPMWPLLLLETHLRPAFPSHTAVLRQTLLSISQWPTETALSLAMSTRLVLQSSPATGPASCQDPGVRLGTEMGVRGEKAWPGNCIGNLRASQEHTLYTGVFSFQSSRIKAGVGQALYAFTQVACLDAANILQQVPWGLRPCLCLVRGVCGVGLFRKGFGLSEKPGCPARPHTLCPPPPSACPYSCPTAPPHDQILMHLVCFVDLSIKSRTTVFLL